MKKEQFIIYNLNDNTKMYIEDVYAEFALLKAYAKKVDKTPDNWNNHKNKLKKGKKSYIIEDSAFGTLAMIKPKQAIKQEIKLYENHNIKPKYDFNYLHVMLGNEKV
ncbi:hypothetical protein [Oceanobacillus sp. FSL K6-0251]|uniref:hypothetical protein n=1 Tax=Oceanobacillus sp. FSL K6-0251 TaxID=2921602 RepID=UPI0030F8F518